MPTGTGTRWERGRTYPDRAGMGGWTWGSSGGGLPERACVAAVELKKSQPCSVAVGAHGAVVEVAGVHTEWPVTCLVREVWHATGVVPRCLEVRQP